MSQKAVGIDPNEYPYLSQVDKLKFSYPALGVLAHRLLNKKEEGRQIVDRYGVDQNGNPPGRCCALEFRTSTTDAWVRKEYLNDEASLRKYLEKHSPIAGDPVDDDCKHRLYILEDLAPEYVDLLGKHLHIDPLVFASQINSWRFLNTGTVGQRTLPSLNNPWKSFSVRYPELRSFREILNDWRWTFAINRRKIDPWFPVEGGRVNMTDEVALVRRCASFWVDNPGSAANGWNALLLVDPPVDAHKDPAVRDSKGEMVTYRILRKQLGANQKEMHYEAALHSSKPFHFGHPDPIAVEQAIKFTAAGSGTGRPVYRKKQSLFDETILYWTQKDNEDMIKSAVENPCNTMSYVLKIAAYHWTNMLELVLLTLNQGEFVADEERHREQYVSELFANSDKVWKSKILKLYQAIWYLNIFRRRLAFFEDDLDLALERLNPHDGYIDSLPSALRDATIDFKSLLARLRLYKSRAEALASTADEIVNMRGAAKSLDDSTFNLRLAIFAAVVFPSTFIASVFGMSDGYKPGDDQFWIFWVVSIPLVIMMVAVVAGWASRFRDLIMGFSEPKARK
ncbi:hypothetical protein V2W45_1248686 [Cenococcum geophilum]